VDIAKVVWIRIGGREMRLFQVSIQVQPSSVQAGPSSQTTSMEIENLVTSRMQCGFFNAESPNIRPAVENPWEEAAKSILQERAELWEKLSKI